MSKTPCSKCQPRCRGCKVSEAAVYGDNAKRWANDLILGESRGPGDLPNAMRRLEARYGIAASTFFSLRYRAAKEPKIGLYVRLEAAWQDFRARQLKALQHETAIAKAARPDRNSVRSAQAVLERAIQAGLISRSHDEEGDA